MSEVCPISKYRTDEKTARFNAFLTLAALAAFLFTPYKWVIFLLGLEFFARGFINPKYSLFARIARPIQKLIGTGSEIVDAAPKMFASKIGFVCCVFISVFYLFEKIFLANVVSWVLIVFAFLEGAFGLCVGCKIYSVLCRYQRRTLD